MRTHFNFKRNGWSLVCWVMIESGTKVVRGEIKAKITVPGIIDKEEDVTIDLNDRKIILNRIVDVPAYPSLSHSILHAKGNVGMNTIKIPKDRFISIKMRYES